MRADFCQQHADRVTVPDHHPVNPAHIPALGRDTEPAGRADQRERGLRPRRCDLQGAGAARLGQRTVGQERPAPRSRGVAGRARHHLRRQSPHRSAPLVKQPGRPRQLLTVTLHPDDVARRTAQPTRGEHRDARREAEHLRDLAAQPAGGGTRVELGFDDDAATHDVQPATEAQQRGHLRSATTWLRHPQPAELVLDGGGHCGHTNHSSPSRAETVAAGSPRTASSETSLSAAAAAAAGPGRAPEPAPVMPANTALNAAASRRGSWRGSPG